MYAESRVHDRHYATLALRNVFVVLFYCASSTEHYIQIGGWVNATHVYLLWLNRPQNKRIFTLYDLSSTQSVTLQPVREVMESSTAWIEVSNVSGSAYVIACVCMCVCTVCVPLQVHLHGVQVC